MNTVINRRDLQSAISKASELRELHATLTHGINTSPATLRMLPGSSPSLISKMSGGDYPVFTPSCGDDPFPGHRNRRTLSEVTWTGSLVEGGVRTKEDEIITLPASCQNHIEHPLPPQPNMSGRDSFKFSRPTNSTELATCNECRPATISVEDVAGDTKKKKKKMMTTTTTMGHRRNTTMSTDTHFSSSSSVQLPLKTRPSIVSWLFPRPKKTSSCSRAEMVEPEDNDCGIRSLELLKKEVRDANMSRDVALAEAGEMRSTLEDLKTKMTQLETYCKDLKNTYRQTMQGRRDIKSSSPSPGYLTHRRRISGRKKLAGGGRTNDNTSSCSSNSDVAMPVSYEVMVEGFLQIVSEARLAVAQFCKTLINPVTGWELPGNLTSHVFLEPSSSSSLSSASIYKLEAVITQSLYQDFENCVFQSNGHPNCLNPRKERREKFAAFVTLRNLTWNQVLGKGTNNYSEEFSRFCDFKMNRVFALLDRSSPWHEELLHSFFVSTKCIWLVHLLAFSFDPPLAILRVGENFRFDPAYMRDVSLDGEAKAKGCTDARVKFMVTPGFYVREKVIKCKVFCTHK